MNIFVVWCVLSIVFSITAILAYVVNFLTTRSCQSRNFISKKEYEKFVFQANFSSSVAHGGGKLCPNKEFFDLVQDGSKRSEFKFPSVDF